MRIPAEKLIRNAVQRHCKDPAQSTKGISSTIAAFSSECKPFVTAVSDFLYPTQFERKTKKHEQLYQDAGYQICAKAISDFLAPFGSPESDYSARADLEIIKSIAGVNEQLFTLKKSTNIVEPFGSPESDYSARADLEIIKSIAGVHEQLFTLKKSRNNFDNKEMGQSTVYSHSYASPESDFTLDMMTGVKKAQHEQVAKKRAESQHSGTNCSSPLTMPSTFDEERLFASPHAFVVTEKTAPFRIVSVNPAWEKLCGFTKEECVGKTSGILHGPETDKAAVTASIAQMMKGEIAGMELLNYDKHGRKFRNRLTLGPLKTEETNEVTHYIGFLQEVYKTKAA